MRTNKAFAGSVFASLVLIAGSPASAHHGTSVTYNTSKSMTLNGTVTDFKFQFPHIQIYFDVADSTGKVAKWATELAPTPTMARNLQVGWSRTSIKPGDKLTLTCAPHRVEGATACLAQRIVVNGALLPLNDAQKSERAGAPAPAPAR